jgi:ABC-type transport system involved in multi-copper enzyme maturation permease subunit
MKSLAMVALTIREAIMRGTLLFYFAVGNIIIVIVAYAIGLSPDGSTMHVFGNPVVIKNVIDLNPVDFILIHLFRSSNFAIMFLGIFAVAGLIPSMLEKGTAELYLSKPFSRTSLLFSRSLGATTGVALNILYFGIAIWLVVGIRVGVWHWKFLLACLLAGVAFTFYFSVVVITGLITRSQGFSIMLAFLFWFLSGALAGRESGLYRLWDNVVYHRVLDGLFYATPQVSGMLENAARVIGNNPFDRMLGPQAVTDFTIMPFVYSLLSATLIFALAAYYFSKQDY